MASTLQVDGVATFSQGDFAIVATGILVSDDVPIIKIKGTVNDSANSGKIQFRENDNTNGFDLRYDGSGNNFVIDSNNVSNVLVMARTTGLATFASAVTAGTSTAGSQSGSTTLDFTANQNFVLTLTGNITLANPTTENVGQSGFITLIQDGTGSRTLAVGSQYFGPGGAVPTISTAANSIDIIPYIVIAAGKIALGQAQLAFADAS